MWTYNDQQVVTHDELLPGCISFVYIITYTNGQKYFGKKTVRSIRRKPPLKGKKRNRRILTNLPFVNYEGSFETEEELEVESKIILYQCSSVKAATYLETALLFHYDAIFDPAYLNKNINGKFFDNDLNGLLGQSNTTF